MHLQDIGHQVDETLSHKDSEGQEMQTFERIRQAFVIAREAAKTGQPTKAAFDDPTARQEHKALLGAGCISS